MGSFLGALHLGAVFSFIVLLTESVTENWTVQVTDDWWSLFTAGNLLGSCQRIDGDPTLNRGVMSTLLSGSTKLVAVLDVEGNIQARALLRAYLSGDRIVLHLEEIYYANFNAMVLDSTIFACAIEFAKKVGCDLVTNMFAGIGSEEVSEPIKMLGNSYPQYVDAAHRIIEPGEEFELEGCSFLHDHGKYLENLRKQGFSEEIGGKFTHAAARHKANSFEEVRGDDALQVKKSVRLTPG